MRKFSRNQKGMTLVELMVTVAVLAILASVAIPQYTKQTTKARRSDATTALARAAIEMESCRAQLLTFTGCGAADITTTTESGDYTISVAVTGGGAGYTLTATPVAGGKQASDAQCGNLTLTSTGAKGHSGTASSSSLCWQT